MSPIIQSNPECIVSNADLRISLEEVVLEMDGTRAAWVPRGLDGSDTDRIRDLDRIRHRLDYAGRALCYRQAVDPVHQTAIRSVGSILARAFMDDEAVDLLSAAIHRLEATAESLTIGLSIIDPTLRDLPWETVRLDTVELPLGLHPNVYVYRQTDAAATPTWEPESPQLPFDILAVVAGPSDEYGGLPALGIDQELEAMARCVGATTSSSLTIAEYPSIKDLTDLVQHHRFSLVHVICHSRPGTLLLEGAGRKVQQVTGEQLLTVFSSVDWLPCLVLASCSTAQGADPGTPVGEPTARDLASTLVAGGIPAVVGMTTPVSDSYAAAFFGVMYETLISQSPPDLIASCCIARRAATTAVSNAFSASHFEWTAPIVVAGSAEMARIARPDSGSAASPYPGGSLQANPGVGHRPRTVDRRYERIAILNAIRSPPSCAILNGIAGVGKSTVAQDVAMKLREDGEQVIVVGSGLSALQLLSEICAALSQRVSGVDRPAPASEPNIDSLLEDALQLADAVVETHPLPITLVIDPLDAVLDLSGDWRSARLNNSLASFLDYWAGHDRRQLLLVGRRHFDWQPTTTHAARRVSLGPLSRLQHDYLLRKLQLPVTLDDSSRTLVWEVLGGSPLALTKLESALQSYSHAQSLHSGDNEYTAGLSSQPKFTLPGSEPTTNGADLLRVLRQVLDEVARDSGFEELRQAILITPLATQVLDFAAAYRHHMGRDAMAWGVSERTSDDEEALRRLAQWGERLSLGTQITEGEQRQMMADLTFSTTPPIKIPKEFDAALEDLERLGLISKLTVDDEVVYVIDQWVKMLVLEGLDGQTRDAVHRAAADFWMWKYHLKASELLDDVWLMSEAREHLFEASAIAEGYSMTRQVCAELWNRGQKRDIAVLVQDTISRPGLSKAQSADLYRLLGVVSENSGDLESARIAFENRLTITSSGAHFRESAEETYDRAILDLLRGNLGDAEARLRHAVSAGDSTGESPVGLHELATIAIFRGNYGEARTLLTEVLSSETADVSSAYLSLGIIAHLLEDYPNAENYYQEALGQYQKVSDMSGIAKCFYQLGCSAEEQGDLDSAHSYAQASLDINESAGNTRAVGMNYYHLGIIALERVDLDTAQLYFERALAVTEGAGMVLHRGNAHHQLGRVAFERGLLPEAERWFKAALKIFDDNGNRHGAYNSNNELGRLAMKQGNADLAKAFHTKALRLAADVGHLKNVRASHEQLSMLSAVLGNLDDAIRHFLESAGWTSRDLDELGPTERGRYLHGTAALAHTSGDLDRAAAGYVQAIESSSLGGDISLAACSCGNLAELHIRWGKLATAEALAMRAFTLHLAADPSQLANDMALLRELDAAKRRRRRWFHRERKDQVLLRRVAAAFDSAESTLGISVFGENPFL